MFEQSRPTGEDDGLLDTLAAEVRALEPPVDLLAQADAAVRQTLATEPPRRRRPSGLMWTAGLAAAAAVVVLLLAPGRDTLVFADVMSAMRTIEAVHAEGWIRDESGRRVPYRQWVRADGDLRVEVGPDSALTRIVVSGDRRQVRPPDGPLLVRAEPSARHPDLDEAMRAVFAGYDDPATWQRHWESTRQDLGDVERFGYRDAAALGRRPGGRRHVLDVDRATRLPVRAEVHEFRDERWWQVSELRYGDYNVPPAPALFALDADADEPRAMTPDDEAAQWFALGVGLPSLYVPAALVPAGGVEVRWLTGQEAGFAPISSGASTVVRGGVSTSTFLNMPLGTVVQALSRLEVADNDVAARRVSVEIRAKAALPWPARTADMLAHLEVAAGLTTTTETITRLVFTQDGRAIAASDQRFAGYSVHADSAGYHFDFARQRLDHIVNALLGNSDAGGVLAGGYDVEFAAGDDAPASVFATLVDFAFTNPGADWQDNLRALEREFGVRWTSQPVVRERKMIELTAVGAVR